MPKKTAPTNILIVERLELEDERGKPRERFSNPIDAIEHAVNPSFKRRLQKREGESSNNG
jgi:hypothetical protein